MRSALIFVLTAWFIVAIAQRWNAPKDYEWFAAKANQIEEVRDELDQTKQRLNVLESSPVPVEGWPAELVRTDAFLNYSVRELAWKYNELAEKYNKEMQKWRKRNPPFHALPESMDKLPE